MGKWGVTPPTPPTSGGQGGCGVWGVGSGEIELKPQNPKTPKPKT
ncbi:MULTISPECIES: hypothetical protein [unclassified Microcystis]|nr:MULTISPECIES: hypothetical protein [unclassified Microcystis]